MKWRYVGYLTAFIFVFGAIGMLSAERPAEYKSWVSMFFRDWTKKPNQQDAWIPVMASDGYRLPVEVTGMSLGSVSMSVATQFLATDTQNRAIVVPTGTVDVRVTNSVGGSQFVATDSANRVVITIASPSLPVTVTNAVQTQSTATDSSNRMVVNIGAAGIGSLPVNIVNGLPVPIIPQFIATDSLNRAVVVPTGTMDVNITNEIKPIAYATDTSDRLRTVIDNWAEMPFATPSSQILATGSNGGIVVANDTPLEVSVRNAEMPVKGTADADSFPISVRQVVADPPMRVDANSLGDVAVSINKANVTVPVAIQESLLTQPQILATDTENRLIVVPTGTMNVTVDNQVPLQALATGPSGGILVESDQPLITTVEDGLISVQNKNIEGSVVPLTVNVSSGDNDPVYIKHSDQENPLRVTVQNAVEASGVTDVNITNEIKPIEYATNTSNHLMVEVSNATVPTKITNWAEMPFATPAAQVTYATDSMNRMKVNLDTATSTPFNVVVQGGTLTMDIPTDPVDGSMQVSLVKVATTTPLNVLIATSTPLGVVVNGGTVTIDLPLDPYDGSLLTKYNGVATTTPMPISVNSTPGALAVGGVRSFVENVGSAAPRLMRDMASDTQPVPALWYSMRNTGVVNIYYAAGFTVTQWNNYIAPGETFTVCVATNTPNYAFQTFDVDPGTWAVDISR